MQAKVTVERVKEGLLCQEPTAQLLNKHTPPSFTTFHQKMDKRKSYRLLVDGHGATRSCWPWARSCTAGMEISVGFRDVGYGKRVDVSWRDLNLNSFGFGAIECK